jgi:hypothetical protein
VEPQEEAAAESPVAQPTRRILHDAGSSKKAKRRKRTRELLTATPGQELEEADEESAKMVGGLERETAFHSGENRHMLFEGSLLSMLDDARRTKSRPSFLSRVDSFLKSLLDRRLWKNVPLVKGVPASGAVFDVAFISLPNNLRVNREDLSVPPWNTWDDTLPGHFFNSMFGLLADSGFAVVLSSTENFSYRRRIFDAAERKERFKPVASYSVILPSPLYKMGSDIQVMFSVSRSIRVNPSLKFYRFFRYSVIPYFLWRLFVNGSVSKKPRLEILFLIFVFPKIVWTFSSSSLLTNGSSFVNGSVIKNLKPLLTYCFPFCRCTIWFLMCFAEENFRKYFRRIVTIDLFVIWRIPPNAR